MRILYCVYQLGVGGGVERVLTLKANWLKMQGYDVRITTCCPMHNPSPYGLDPSIPIECFDIDYAAEFHKGICKRFFITLAKMWRHACLMRQYLRDNPVDVVVTTHAYEMAFLPFLRDGSKKVLELHASQKMYQMQRYKRKGRALKFLVKLLTWRDRAVNFFFDAVGCLTEEDYTFRGRPKNMHIIPNPSPFTTDTPSVCTALTVLAVGRHTEEKDFFSLVDIWAMLAEQYPDWRLQIVGGGYLKAQLETKIRDLGLCSSIILEEETANPCPYYKEASIYVMTSTFEGMPMTLIEAQSYGLPIVSYACPCGPVDVVTEGTGYVVPAGDKEAFTEKLKLLMSDTILRQTMAQEAYKASGRYLPTRVMQQWVRLFDQLQDK